MGEAYGRHSFGNDERLMAIIDVANVACGFHSGDPDVMDATVALAAAHGVLVGAHPGLPDTVGFGRREMKLTPDEVEALIRYQVGALSGFLVKYSLPLNHIKPHGSLYGMLSRDDELMRAAARVAADYGVPIFGLSGTAHERIASEAGIGFVSELYVDLNYDASGGLLIQRAPAPTDPAAAAARVTRALADGTVLASDGTPFATTFQSVCVHSDAANSVSVAEAVRGALSAAR